MIPAFLKKSPVYRRQDSVSGSSFTLNRRPLTPAEVDYEFMLTLLGALVLAAFFIWRSFPFLLPLPACHFLAITGYPCLTCGATRTVLALSRGDFLLALQLNPLVCISIVTGIVFWLICLLQVIVSPTSPRKRLRFFPPLRNFSPALRYLLFAIILLNWLYLLTLAPLGWEH